MSEPTIARGVLLREARFVGFALVTCLMRQQKILRDHFDMTPTQAVVFLTIALASAQRYVRSPSLGDEYRGVKQLPPAYAGSISRRAVADSVGLPRETVRRLIRELVAAGVVTEVERGRVTTGAGLLVPEAAQQALGNLAMETARLFKELVQLGVLVE